MTFARFRLILQIIAQGIAAKNWPCDNKIKYSSQPLTDVPLKLWSWKLWKVKILQSSVSWQNWPVQLAYQHCCVTF